MQTRILVVDDDPDLLDLLQVCLVDRGFEVATAATGRRAMERVETFRPDVVVLDLILPETDGFVVCETLKRSPGTASIPVILITGLSSQMARFNGLESGADDFLTKPFDPEQLIAKIFLLLSKSKGDPKDRNN